MIEPINMSLYSVERLTIEKRMFILSETPVYSIVDNGEFIVEISARNRTFFTRDDVYGINRWADFDEVLEYLMISDHAIDHEVLDWLMFNLDKF